MLEYVFGYMWQKLWELSPMASIYTTAYDANPEEKHRFVSTCTTSACHKSGRRLRRIRDVARDTSWRSSCHVTKCGRSQIRDASTTHDHILDAKTCDLDRWRLTVLPRFFKHGRSLISWHELPRRSFKHGGLLSLSLLRQPYIAMLETRHMLGVCWAYAG